MNSASPNVKRRKNKMAKKIIWRSESYKTWARRLVHMSPTKFLSLCTKPPQWSQSSIKGIQNRIKQGKAVETPYLDVNIKTGEVTGHEGRHRAIVARRMGIKKIPVHVYFKEYKKGQYWGTFVTAKGKRLPRLKRER